MSLAMILAVALVQEPAPTPTTTPDDHDIVVVASKMKRIRLRLDRRGTTLRQCKVRVSSGDADLDNAACAAVASCLAEDQRKRPALESCVTKRSLDYYFDRQATRAAAKDASIDLQK